MVETVSIDNQRRVYVSRALFEQCELNVPAGKTIIFWAAIGEFGQVQLLPRDSELSKIRDSVDDSSATETDWDAGGDFETRVRRHLQTFLEVKCRARTKNGKVEMTFYAAAIDQGHLVAPSMIVVVTTGKIFEVWTRENWQRFSRILDLRRFTEEARKLLRTDR
jgi:hypothetical protein